MARFGVGVAGGSESLHRLKKSVKKCIFFCDLFCRLKKNAYLCVNNKGRRHNSPHGCKGCRSCTDKGSNLLKFLKNEKVYFFACFGVGFGFGVLSCHICGAVYLGRFCDFWRGLSAFVRLLRRSSCVVVVCNE